MMKKWVIGLACILVAGCGADHTAERDNNQISLIKDEQAEIIEVSTAQQQSNMHVRAFVQKNNVYVETMIPAFHFVMPNKNPKKGEGHLHVIIDGKKVMEIYQAAFIIKGLSKGQHTIQLIVAGNDHKLTDIKKTVFITIP